MEATKEKSHGRHGSGFSTGHQAAASSARRSQGRVYSRHRSECKWRGDDTRLGCDCPKQLTWFRDGKIHRLAADTCDGEVAESKARGMMNGFEAAAKGEPTPVKETGTLLDDAVKIFLEMKAKSGITQKTRLKFELESFRRSRSGAGWSIWATFARSMP